MRLWVILIIGFVLFSLLPTGYELSHVKLLRPERSFELVHNFPTDYNFYLSRIRQGLDGKWTVTEKYTSEPHNPSLIHEMYIVMGEVGRFLRVPFWRAGDVYHVARIVLAVTLLSMIAVICQKYPFGLAAFFLAVTASSWPKLVYVDGIPRFGGYMSWWSVMDSLQRITFIPHILAGQILIIFLIYELTKKNIQKNTLFLGLLGFLLGMVFPPGLVFVYVVLGVYALLNWTNKTYLSYLGFVLISCSALIYLYLMTGFYPWKRLAEVDIIRPLPFDYWEYAKAIGPIGPIGLIGLIWALRKKEIRMYPVVAWVVAWLGLLFVFKFIPAQSPLRFSEMIPHVPLGILAAYLFYKMKFFKYFFPITLVLLGLGQMYSSWLWQKDFVDHKMRAATPLVPYDSYVMYPLDDFMAALYFLHDHYPQNAVILSDMTAGNYIPVYSGNSVYIGHDNTVHLEVKKEVVKRFFSGLSKPEDARSFLQKNNISAIFYGPQEKENLPAGRQAGDLSKAYPFLKQVYKNNFIFIYEINNP